MDKPILMQKIYACHSLNEKVKSFVFGKLTLLVTIPYDEK